jgi:hypothetical protein
MLGMITWGKARDKRMVGMKCVGKDLSRPGQAVEVECGVYCVNM